jgi:hypothetical protein
MATNTECYEFATGNEHRTIVLINHLANTASVYTCKLGSNVKHRIVDRMTGVRFAIDLMKLFPIMSESVS